MHPWPCSGAVQEVVRRVAVSFALEGPWADKGMCCARRRVVCRPPSQRAVPLGF
jgi:hypothetical protein